MGRKTYTAQEKQQVKQLLLRGESYGDVKRKTGIPTSTISTWYGKKLSRPHYEKARLDHLASIRALAQSALKKKWGEWRKEQWKDARTTGSQTLAEFPFDNLGVCKALLAMLYWAEGSKHEKASGPRFVNTDPELMSLYVTLLRRCYKIDEKKLSVRIHIHHYHSPQRVKQFWSQKLNIPLEQFGKIHTKERSKTKKFRENFMGICFVYYGDSMIRKELMELGSALGRIITKSHESIIKKTAPRSP